MCKYEIVGVGVYDLKGNGLEYILLTMIIVL